MSNSWQILNIAHITRKEKREDPENEKEKLRSQVLLRKYVLWCGVGNVFLCLMAIYMYMSSTHLFRESGIRLSENTTATLDPSREVIAVVMSAKWNEVRRKNSLDICEYFDRNGVKCVVMDGYDGRNISKKEKQYLIDQGYIHKKFNEKHIDTKIATAISKILAMKTVIALAQEKPP
ncbi:hypothetical protein RFI_15446, partial [Reticulomyxa filosa]